MSHEHHNQVDAAYHGGPDEDPIEDLTERIREPHAFTAPIDNSIEHSEKDGPDDDLNDVVPHAHQCR